MEEKAIQLKRVTSSLDGILDFLTDHLPLANAHGSEFITARQWESLLPESIQNELLQVPEDELAKLPTWGEALSNNQRVNWSGHTTGCNGSQCCGQSDHPSLEDRLTDSESVEQQTCVDQLLVSEESQTRRDMKSTPESFADSGDRPGGASRHTSKSHLAGNEAATTGGLDSREYSVNCPHGNRQCVSKDGSLPPVWKQGSLAKFCLSAWQCSLEGQKQIVNVQDFFTQLKVTPVQGTCIAAFMNQKKSYETGIMADICATLAQYFSCKLAVDVGSGKGYLGCQLCLQHRLSVLGIDNVVGNTSAAVLRSTRLSRQWKNLMAALQRESGQPKPKKKNKNCSGSSGDDQSRNITEVNSCDKCNDSTLQTVTCDLNTKLNLNGVECGHKSDEVSTIGGSRPGISSHARLMQPQYVPVTMHVRSDTNIAEVVETHFPQLNKIPDTDRPKDSELHPSCIKGQPELNSSNSFSVGLGSVTGSMTTCLLTGLHTCGNLGSSTLRLFVGSPDIRAMCSVGCCYHLLDEAFPSEPGVLDKACGFPMSQYLKQRKICLGKTAKNLAQQAVHRMTTYTELQGARFFPRALLQKILQDVYGDVAAGQKGFRSLEQDSKDTRDYIQKGLELLQLKDDKVTANLIDSYMEKYGGCRQELAAFFQLRAVLAPCIEALIVLDRTCYLLEQECVKGVSIVKLFDPQKSPRCYGIIAWK